MRFGFKDDSTAYCGAAAAPAPAPPSKALLAPAHSPTFSAAGTTVPVTGTTHTTVPTTGTTGTYGTGTMGTTGATAEGTPTTTQAARTHVAEGEGGLGLMLALRCCSLANWCVSWSRQPLMVCVLHLTACVS